MTLIPRRLRLRGAGKLLVPAGLFILVSIGVIGAFGGYTYQKYASEFVPPDQVGINQPSGGAKILDRNGKLLFQYVDDTDGLRKPVPLDQISPHLLAATIATEDASFYSNPGVSYSGLARALWENVKPFGHGPLRGSGGSSITQQLVKNVYFSSQERSDRSLSRKVKETVFAFKLTDEYSKEQILTWYLNQISYGGVYNGIESASEGYFGKPAKDLTLAEAALLAGIPQSPALYDPELHPDAAVERRNQVLDLLAQHTTVRVGSETSYMMTKEEIEAAKVEPLKLAPTQPFDINAPHFVLTYLQPELEQRFGSYALHRDGLTITTTLDLDLQNQAEKVLNDRIGEFEAQSNSHNGAVVVLAPQTGEVLAMVGSRDYNLDDIQGKNNNLLALNSPGSTLKPFVYLATFMKFNAGPGTLIDDAPISYKQNDGSLFTPKNPAGNFQGTITMRTALGNSLNVPAARAAATTGVDAIVALGRKAGLTTLNGSYGPAIATGGVDVKPFDLAFAYSVLANGGLLRGETPAAPHGAAERELDPVSILKVVRGDGNVIFDANSIRGERRVAPEEFTFMVNSILSDPQAECQTFGCGGIQIPGYTAGVKTGTSEPFDPNGPDAGKIGETLAFGYTADVVVGVWAGNADNSPVTNLSSTSIAYHAMRDVFLAFYNGRPASPFVQPPGVVRANICVPQKSICVNDFFSRNNVPPPPADPAPVSQAAPANQAPGQPQVQVPGQSPLTLPAAPQPQPPVVAQSKPQAAPAQDKKPPAKKH